MAIKCAKCNKFIGRTDDYLTCSGNCNSSYHLGCTDIDKTTFTNLYSSGKVKVNDWKCGFCAPVDKSIGPIVPKLIDENALNDLPTVVRALFASFSASVSSHFDSLQTTIQKQLTTLTQRITDLQNENTLLRDEIQLITSTLRPVDSPNLNTPPKIASYADKLNKTCTTVVIKPKTTTQTVSKTKTDIINKIDPAECKLSIAGVRSIKNGGILVKCPNPSEFKKFADDNKLNESYEIRNLKPRSPRLRISGISSELSKDHIISFLVKQNKSIFSDSSQVKLLKLLPTKKNADIFQIILQVDIISYNKALELGHCLIGLDNCYIFDAVNVTRCFQCNGYNHNRKFCRKDLSCPRCGEAHEIKECESLTLKCINCTSIMSKANLTLNDVAHAVWDVDKCSYYKNLIDNIKKELFGNLSSST